MNTSVVNTSFMNPTNVLRTFYYFPCMTLEDNVFFQPEFMNMLQLMDVALVMQTLCQQSGEIRTAMRSNSGSSIRKASSVLNDQ